MLVQVNDCICGLNDLHYILEKHSNPKDLKIIFVSFTRKDKDIRNKVIHVKHCTYPYT